METAVNSPSRRPDENQRPNNPGVFPPNIQTGGHKTDELTLEEVLFPSSPSDDGAIPSNTEPNEDDAPFSNSGSNELEAVPSNTGEINDFRTFLASLDESDDEQEPCIENEIPKVGEARAVPTVFLETPPNRGLDDDELRERRTRYGWNYMKEDKRSHFKIFLSFFVGPIQFVMLVSQGPYPSSRCPVEAYLPKTSRLRADVTLIVGVCTGCRTARLDRSGSHCGLALAQCSCWLFSRLSSREYRPRTQAYAGTEMYSLAQRWDHGRRGRGIPGSGGHCLP